MRVGAVISNVEFQAGAFDMASAEKFCRLLVECAERQLPVIVLHLVGRHADEGRRRRALLDGRRERSHHAVRPRSRAAGHRLRLRRLHRRRSGELRHASARADLLLLRHQHAVRRPDRRAVEPAAHVDALQLPVAGARRDAGPGETSVLRRSSIRRCGASIPRSRCPSETVRRGGPSRAARDPERGAARTGGPPRPPHSARDLAATGRAAC